MLATACKVSSMPGITAMRAPRVIGMSIGTPSAAAAASNALASSGS